ncbi:hypothetical protein [Xanthocytophaga agilis]|uniref:hypothetical protein n=1 Tax=Xanthocytophaga agilis TaxID=3048010 RepID=UPI0028D8883D|nr:hypothetical protein [Xanthocytophaga agilis]
MAGTFSESWCTRNELVLQVENHLEAMRKSNYSVQATYLKTMAFYHMEELELSWKL